MSDYTNVQVPLTQKQFRILSRVASRERISVEWLLHCYVKELAIMCLDDE